MSDTFEEIKARSMPHHRDMLDYAARFASWLYAKEELHPNFILKVRAMHVGYKDWSQRATHDLVAMFDKENLEEAMNKRRHDDAGEGKEATAPYVTTAPLCGKDRRRAQVENAFTYHAPRDGQQAQYEAIRNHAKSLAFLLLEECPESRELSLALTKLEEVVFFANASIARS